MFRGLREGPASWLSVGRWVPAASHPHSTPTHWSSSVRSRLAGEAGELGAASWTVVGVPRTPWAGGTGLVGDG